MEEFSLTKDAAADPRAAARLTALRAEMGTLEGRQRALADRWREERGAPISPSLPASPRISQ